MKRLTDLIGSKLNDLLVIGVRNASYNDRDIVMEPDLPLTKGFLEHMQDFRRYDEQLELKPILDHLATYPPLERALSLDIEAILPDLAGTSHARWTRHEDHRSRCEESRRRYVGKDAMPDGLVAVKSWPKRKLSLTVQESSPREALDANLRRR
jgi:hypothetical protein